MRHNYLLLFFIVTTLLGCSDSNKKQFPYSSANELRALLKDISGKAVLFGHQDDLAYGIGWEYEEGESDVLRVTGDYPALFGWELGGLELGHSANLDNVPFEKIKDYAVWVFEKGGLNTFSWHPYSVLDESKNAWYSDEVVVKHILPGGSHFEAFKCYLDCLVSFFNSLQTSSGYSVPFIFRPWHEMDGAWFWWGAHNTKPDELKELFRFTIDYLHENGVNNFLAAYSPDRNFNNIQEYLSWYPGDDYVDILGVDNYYDLQHGEEGLKKAIQKFELVAKYAKQKEKIVAFTETGLDQIKDDKWYSESLGTLLNANKWTRSISYVMVWRNHDLTHFYVPHIDHQAATDFQAFTNEPFIFLLEDWNLWLEGKENRQNSK